MNRTAQFIGVLASTTLVATAWAADLPVLKSPPLAPLASPPPAYNWTGPYVGASAGYGWASANQTFGITSDVLAAAPPIIPVIEGSGSQRLSLRGALIEGEAGYNWQLNGGYVVGVAADSQWTDLSGSTFNGGNIPNFPPGTPYSIGQKFNPNWEGSLRARVGFTPIDRLLIYATGGPALAHLNYASAFTDVFNENEDIAIHTIKPGWTVGLGAEYALAANWSLEAEYRYSQFSAATATGFTLLNGGGSATGAHSTGVLDENSVRLGVNYHFD